MPITKTNDIKSIRKSPRKLPRKSPRKSLQVCINNLFLHVEQWLVGFMIVHLLSCIFNLCLLNNQGSVNGDRSSLHHVYTDWPRRLFCLGSLQIEWPNSEYNYLCFQIIESSDSESSPQKESSHSKKVVVNNIWLQNTSSWHFWLWRQHFRIPGYWWGEQTKLWYFNKYLLEKEKHFIV